MNAKKLWNTGLRPETPAGSARLNRAVLFCNLGVLLVNFFLAYKTTDAQIGLMDSANPGGARIVRRREPSEAAMPYLRPQR